MTIQVRFFCFVKAAQFQSLFSGMVLLSSKAGRHSFQPDALLHMSSAVFGIMVE